MLFLQGHVCLSARLLHPWGFIEVVGPFGYFKGFFGAGRVFFFRDRWIRGSFELSRSHHDVSKVGGT